MAKNCGGRTADERLLERSSAMPLPTCVLVTDGDERAALAVTRALGARGIEIIVGAEQKRSLAAASKYCAKSFAYPSPYRDPQAFVDCLLGAITSRKVDALFPISDIAMHVIGPRKGDFERHTHMPIPDYKIFEETSDKYRLMKSALQLNVAIPDTIFVSGGDIRGISDRITSFPVVIKPGCSLIRTETGWQKTSVHYAKNADEVRNLYRQHEYLRRPSLIQQRVLGEGQGIFALMNDGKPLALFAHRRIREKPPSGGVSVLRESIPLDKGLVEPALRLLQHVRWHGVAMVEFKIDHDSKVPVLMEINGRFWGSLQLAIDAGMNFPWLLFQMAAGRIASLPENGYQSGIKSRWLLGDLDHLLLRLRKPEASLNLPPGAPSKWQCLKDFAKFVDRDMFYELEKPDDIRPFLYELRQYAKLN
ncbi:MAG: ATP-grasp domain-containing protein [Nitrospira sp.]